MNPGRELDALIAEKVMGLLINGTAEHADGSVEPAFGNANGISGQAYPARNYSTDIAAAWQIAEKLKEKKLYLSLSITRFGSDQAYEASVSNQIGARICGEYGDTPAIAICRAALKAINL